MEIEPLEKAPESKVLGVNAKKTKATEKEKQRTKLGRKKES